MEDFKSRLDKEHKDLISKLNALMGFIDSEKFKSIDENQKMMLFIQKDIMRSYATILEARISTLL